MYSGFSGAGTGLESMPQLESTTGAHTYSATFTATELDTFYMLYLAGHPLQMYLGNFTITVLPTPSYGGDTSVAGTVSWDQDEYVMEVTNATLIESPSELSGIEGFGDCVLYLDNTGNNNDSFVFNGTKGLFEAGKTYEITFTYYVIESEGWMYSGFAGAGATGFEVLPPLSESAGIHTYAATFTATEADEAYMIFMASHPLKMYLGAFTVTVVQA